MSVALLFPGQAAQFVGMGAKLMEASSSAKSIMSQSDEILGYKLSDVMIHGPEERLKETIYTQPAVFVHSYLMYLQHKDTVEVEAVAGHSLGEITASVAAGVMSYEDGLKLVQQRAEAMQEACEQNPSTMAAILGLEDQVVEEVCDGIAEVVVAANYNCPGQLVISGSKVGIAKAIEGCKAAGAKRALEIAVGGAFHSPLMEPAVGPFKAAIEAMSMKDAIVPIYQNVNASPETDAEAIREHLILQVTSPVRWTQSMQRMIADGYNQYVEVGGKGKILMGMMRKISRDVEVNLWQEV